MMSPAMDSRAVAMMTRGKTRERRGAVGGWSAASRAPAAITTTAIAARSSGVVSIIGVPVCFEPPVRARLPVHVQWGPGPGPGCGAQAVQHRAGQWRVGDAAAQPVGQRAGTQRSEVRTVEVGQVE